MPKPVVIALASALVSVGLAQSAVADPPTAPSMTGENFHGPAEISSENCNADGNSSFTFRATGVATGPYSGPFEEHGEVHIGPQALNGLQFLNGTVQSFNAKFEIDSPAGVVYGTKHIDQSAFFLDQNLGACTPDVAQGYTEAAFLVRGLVYEARIKSDRGVFHDEGTSDGNVFATTARAAELNEGFVSDNGALAHRGQ
jgi:hypothetical protein